MTTERAKKRLTVIAFWEKHGVEAATDAFSVSKRTLFRWRAKLKVAHGHVDGLNEKSTAPERRRKRVYPPGFLDRVITLRRDHHHLGKKKVGVLLGVSESYAGRTLTDLKKRGLLPGEKRLSLMARTGRLIERKPIYRKKIRRSHKRGIETDTIVRFVDGIKRYVYTAIDVERKFTFAAGYRNHSSASAADFFSKLCTVAPFPVTEVQTDNGSEFAHLFEGACKQLNIVHLHTYPRCPKMNACIERFNRTLSEDFIQHHRGLLRDDLSRFNDALIDWLLWYNTERPHESLGMLSPLRYTNQLEEQIPGTYYTEIVDVKFLFADASASFQVILQGTGTGIFTFVINEMRGDSVISNTTFSDLPVTPQTVVTMSLSAGLASASDLAVDENGDGIVDSQYASSTGQLIVLAAPVSASPTPTGGGNGPPMQAISAMTTTSPQATTTATSLELAIVPVEATPAIATSSPSSSASSTNYVVAKKLAVRHAAAASAKKTAETRPVAQVASAVQAIQPSWLKTIYNWFVINISYFLLR